MPCGLCRQNGHNRLTCRHYAEYLVTTDENTVVCNYCGESGHSENRCKNSSMYLNNSQSSSYMYDNAVSTLTTMHSWTQGLNTDNDIPSREPSYSSPNNIVFSTPPRNNSVVGNPPHAPIRSRSNRDILSHPPLTKTLVTCVEVPFYKEDCPICMDVIKKTDSFTTRCGHMFHGTCMLQYMRSNNNCPCCRGILLVT